MRQYFRLTCEVSLPKTVLRCAMCVFVCVCVCICVHVCVYVCVHMCVCVCVFFVAGLESIFVFLFASDY